MTGWAEMANAAMVVIDDIRLGDQLQISPAQFYRRMAAMIGLAYPMLKKPLALKEYIKNGLVKPEFADYEWTSTRESVGSETVLSTGLTGYELCSAVTVSNERGRTIYLPYAGAAYNPVNGDVTLPAQDRDGVSYMLDFYRDGQFPELTDTQRRLMVLAIATVWDERFERNWLANTMKIKDDSFETVNESTYMKQTGERKSKNRLAFDDELNGYEQSCAYSTGLRGRMGYTLI